MAEMGLARQLPPPPIARSLELAHNSLLPLFLLFSPLHTHMDMFYCRRQGSLSSSSLPPLLRGPRSIPCTVAGARYEVPLGELQ
jgi:hypothetical protein